MLNDKQAAFVREYLADFNATQAAIRAGYAKHAAGQQAHKLLKIAEVQAALKDFREKAAEKTLTDTAWVRERLREEATDFSPQASHSARVRAVELIAKMNGDFELDNNQKADPIAEAIAAVQANNIPLAVRP
ncbi:MAG: terminase small subunit [Burkholderiales bacterium]|nr:terminase small subunit [Burkholderiales bacterium]